MFIPFLGMIYEGPGLISKIRDEVAELMIQNGQRNLQQEVVGMDHEELYWKKQRAALADRDATMKTLILDEDGNAEEKENTEAVAAECV
jgi:hypothetical protein